MLEKGNVKVILKFQKSKTHVCVFGGGGGEEQTSPGHHQSSAAVQGSLGQGFKGIRIGSGVESLTELLRVLQLEYRGRDRQTWSHGECHTKFYYYLLLLFIMCTKKERKKENKNN